METQTDGWQKLPIALCGRAMIVAPHLPCDIVLFTDAHEDVEQFKAELKAAGNDYGLVVFGWLAGRGLANARANDPKWYGIDKLTGRIYAMFRGMSKQCLARCQSSFSDDYAICFARKSSCGATLLRSMSKLASLRSAASRSEAAPDHAPGLDLYSLYKNQE